MRRKGMAAPRKEGGTGLEGRKEGKPAGRRKKTKLKSVFKNSFFTCKKGQKKTPV